MEACLICRAPLQYHHEKRDMTCEMCGRQFSENVLCENGHYICNDCHRNGGISVIHSICLSVKSKNPAQILTWMMEDKAVHMHGPEHHLLVGCALLAAYKNAGGTVDEEPIEDLSPLLDEMIARGEEVPGGICGFWGSCGAAISSGIFLSIVTGSNPLQTGEQWAHPNRMTAKGLNAIADVGGPRCCKRNGYIALREAVGYANRLLGVKMEWEDPTCTFYSKNSECIGARCPFSSVK